MSALAEMCWHPFNMRPDVFLFVCVMGSLMFIAASLGLLIKEEWELYIDEYSLNWKAGNCSGVMSTLKIRMVIVNNSESRTLYVFTDDGKYHEIPGDCYGNASELITLFRQNYGDRIDVRNNLLGVKL